MRSFLIQILLLASSLVYSQADTLHRMNVVFLYGSKPKREFRSTEVKYFGGIHGGHVTIQVDGVDYGFEPARRGVHIFPRKNKNADFVDQPLNGKHRYSSDSKTVTFIIPVSEKQYQELNAIHKCYCDTAPFDYAFFGMRCASTTQEILGKIGVVKKRSRFNNVMTTFYPKPLRRRLFKLAEEKNYEVVQTAGRETRKWERD